MAESLHTTSGLSTTGSTSGGSLGGKVIEYQFNYLAHPHPVLSFAWRKSLEPNDNVLLTNSDDGVARIWTQCVGSAFTPSSHSTGLTGGDSSLKFLMPVRFFVSAYITTRPETPHNPRTPFVCHWLHSVDVTLAYLYRNLILENVHDERDLYRKKSEALKKNMREFQDMVMNVGSDGTLSIWGIQVIFVI
jgi:hypothetical protein